jgi:hypothetical protein
LKAATAPGTDGIRPVNVAVGRLDYSAPRPARYKGAMKTTIRSAGAGSETRTSRLVTTLWMLGFAALLLTGCRGGPRAETSADLAGTYTLVSVDDKAVPCEIMHGKVPMTIKSGRFTIAADGTCRSLMNFSVPQRDNLSRETTATFTRAGDQLAMKWKGAGTTRGQVRGDTFTMMNEGMKLQYRK